MVALNPLHCSFCDDDDEYFSDSWFPMFRRLSTGLTALAAVRYYAPSEEMKKLYASNFDKTSFPVNIVPSDSVLFAKFLYKSAEVKGNYDIILKDFQTIASASTKFPIFWERTAVIEEIPELKAVSEPTYFTLVWMQSNGMLDLIPDVAAVYETYVNAKLKKTVARIYVAPGKEQDAKILADAKKVAENVLKDSKELAGHTLVTKTVVDRSIIDGFAVELAGVYVNSAKGKATEAAKADESDFTNIPLPKLPPTTWEDNIQSEVYRKFLDSMTEYDAEEVKHGF